MIHSTRKAVRTAATALLVLTALGALGQSVRAQEQPGWWDRRWPYRKLFTIRGGGAGRDAASASAWVHIRRGAGFGGRDLRVIDPDGQPVDFGVVHSTPEGRHLIAFSVPARGGYYAVYYGNARAGAAPQKLPRAGLIHYTMPIPPGIDSTKLFEVQKAIKDSAKVYGADYWKRVHDGYNPFGPESDYIGVYRGQIQVPQAGQYRFATLSEHSSYLFVDGRLVVRWPGAHNIYQARWGQRSGAATLTAGRHSFLYVHFSYGRPMRCSAAWALPRQKQFKLIPVTAFPMPLMAELYETQALGQPACADFRAEPQSYCEAGGARMVTIKFVPKVATAGDALANRYLWEFGDGQTSADAQPTHAFLETNVFTVKLTATTTSRQRAACTKQVRVKPLWHDLDFRQPKLDSFWNYARRYRLSALTTGSLWGAWEFFRAIEKQERANEALLKLLKRRDELTPERLFDVAMAMAAHTQGTTRDAAEAENYLNMALNAVPATDSARRYKARFALCDNCFYYKREYQRARQEYVKLRADFPTQDRAMNRVALVRIGDTYRSEGDVEKALDTYREAEAAPAYTPDKPRAMIIGAVTHEAQAYMRRGEGEEALKRLEELLWFYPSLRLEGDMTLLRIKAALLQGDFKEAKKHADVYISFAKDRNYLPPVHVAAAEACIELGLTDEAAGHYRTVLDEFKEAPEVIKARDGLVRLGQ